jgi:hypothetical protein
MMSLLGNIFSVCDRHASQFASGVGWPTPATLAIESGTHITDSCATLHCLIAQHYTLVTLQ